MLTMLVGLTIAIVVTAAIQVLFNSALVVDLFTLTTSKSVPVVLCK
jgi:hypothetical protein